MSLRNIEGFKQGTTILYKSFCSLILYSLILLAKNTATNTKMHYGILFQEHALGTTGDDSFSFNQSCVSSSNNVLTVSFQRRKRLQIY